MRDPLEDGEGLKGQLCHHMSIKPGRESMR